jgi:molecular chaperone DnaK (HSP70)
VIEHLSSEQIASLAGVLVTLLTALGGAIVAYLEKIRRDLSKNTTKTEHAASAATAAAKKASDAQHAAEAIQQATFDKLDYDRLRRQEAALLMLDECEPCRAKILALTDRRRLRPKRSESEGSEV